MELSRRYTVPLESAPQELLFQTMGPSVHTLLLQTGSLSRQGEAGLWVPKVEPLTQLVPG